MSRLSFRAWRGKHYVGLAELLCALGGPTADAFWELRIDEVSPGPPGEVLESLAGGPRVTSRDLLLAAFPYGQIIDGEVRGYTAADAPDPFVVVYAVDSTDWDVESTSPAVEAAVREAFPDATDVS